MEAQGHFANWFLLSLQVFGLARAVCATVFPFVGPEEGEDATTGNSFVPATWCLLSLSCFWVAITLANQLSPVLDI